MSPLAEHRQQLLFLLRWTGLAGLTGTLVGLQVAFFLHSLETIVAFHDRHRWLLWLLPVAGIATVLIYRHWGGTASRGNNLILEALHTPNVDVPLRLAPLILITTLLAHLCGASVGREGTAVQMGAGISGWLARRLKLSASETACLLQVGMASGFGAVFGTPIAGAVFALEVPVVGRFAPFAVVPTLLAGLVGDAVCTAFGSEHAPYHIDLTRAGLPGPTALEWNPAWILPLALAAVLFGYASRLFSQLTEAIEHHLARWFPDKLWHPVLGSLAIWGLVWLLGTQDFIGLGARSQPSSPTGYSLASAFEPGQMPAWGWLAKLAFTALCVGSGFKGGEVTPLFFIGAALGNALAGPLGLPVDLLAGLGLVAVFAGASNTPLASTLMAVELFGPVGQGLFSQGFVVYAALCCGLAYLVSGHKGIYASQRFDAGKHHPDWPRDRVA
jgi:H+/Cl- antiporter ClcA